MYETWPQSCCLNYLLDITIVVAKPRTEFDVLNVVCFTARYDIAERTATEGACGKISWHELVSLGLNAY